MFPVYGFGAKIPGGKGEASHCFALNGDIFKPECSRTEGVLNAYYSALKKVEFYDGNHFSEVLGLVNGFADNQAREITQMNQKYTICLIITAGVISDIDRTIDQIVIGSELPVSIIIVGVGNADFTQMELLDGDVNPLYSRKHQKHIFRDIV